MERIAEQYAMKEWSHSINYQECAKKAFIAGYHAANLGNAEYERLKSENSDLESEVLRLKVELASTNSIWYDEERLSNVLGGI